ncbi:unnamed protein product [Lampetra planeri]
MGRVCHDSPVGVEMRPLVELRVPEPSSGAENGSGNPAQNAPAGRSGRRSPSSRGLQPLGRRMASLRLRLHAGIAAATSPLGGRSTADYPSTHRGDQPSDSPSRQGSPVHAAIWDHQCKFSWACRHLAAQRNVCSFLSTTGRTTPISCARTNNILFITSKSRAFGSTAGYAASPSANNALR